MVVSLIVHLFALKQKSHPFFKDGFGLVLKIIYTQHPRDNFAVPVVEPVDVVNLFIIFLLHANIYNIYN